MHSTSVRHLSVSVALFVAFVAASLMDASASLTKSLAQTQQGSASGSAPGAALGAEASKPEAPKAEALKAEKVTPLDPSAQIAQPDDEIPSVFKDVVVVQRKAKQKAGKFLFATSGTVDFSDGPITSYGVNTNIGYALSDFWEVYATVTPTFITVERPIVQKVRELKLANSKQAEITYSRPTFQYGVELLWLPAYGKESWGPYSIVRSDTFFKLGAAQTNFEGGSNGLRFSAMLGKTYFVANWLNLRGSAGVSYLQSIVDNEKTTNWAPVLEAGLVFYF